jgi:predicted nucleotidyltransferase
MAIALTPQQREAITEACRRHRVARLHAFGSVVGSPVDLVMADAVRNPYIKASIEAGKQMLYAA